jgi:hypothetical protein
MDRMIHRKSKANTPLLMETPVPEDPYEEFDRYFSRPPAPRKSCLDIVGWWGVRSFPSSPT